MRVRRQLRTPGTQRALVTMTGHRQRSVARDSWRAAGLACLVFIGPWVRHASAATATVSGTVTYWEQRILTAGGRVPGVGDQPLWKALVYLWEWRGACVDWLANCPESDDALITVAPAVANESGYYEIQN